MQRLTIIGHLGQDAEVKDLGQNQVINFSVAVSESYINKQTNEKVTNTTWYEVAKWGNNTSIAQYLKKGTQVMVEGKPTARSWQKEDASIVSVLGINALNVTLLGSAKSEGTPTPQSQGQHPNNSFADGPKENVPAPAANFTEEDADNLPF